MHSCKIVLLHCCAAALLHCCTAALLLCFTAALLHCCSVALLRCCSVSLLRCCSVALLHCYIVAIGVLKIQVLRVPVLHFKLFAFQYLSNFEMDLELSIFNSPKVPSGEVEISRSGWIFSNKAVSRIRPDLDKLSTSAMSLSTSKPSTNFHIYSKPEIQIKSIVLLTNRTNGPLGVFSATKVLKITLLGLTL